MTSKKIMPCGHVVLKPLEKVGVKKWREAENYLWGNKREELIRRLVDAYFFRIDLESVVKQYQQAEEEPPAKDGRDLYWKRRHQKEMLERVTSDKYWHYCINGPYMAWCMMDFWDVGHVDAPIAPHDGVILNYFPGEDSLMKVIDTVNSMDKDYFDSKFSEMVSLNDIKALAKEGLDMLCLKRYLEEGGYNRVLQHGPKRDEVINKLSWLVCSFIRNYDEKMLDRNEALLEEVAELKKKFDDESTPEEIVEPVVESTPEEIVEPVVESTPEEIVEPVVESTPEEIEEAPVAVEAPPEVEVPAFMHIEINPEMNMDPLLLAGDYSDVIEPENKDTWALFYTGGDPSSMFVLKTRDEVLQEAYDAVNQQAVEEAVEEEEEVVENTKEIDIPEAEPYKGETFFEMACLTLLLMSPILIMLVYLVVTNQFVF